MLIKRESFFIFFMVCLVGCGDLSFEGDEAKRIQEQVQAANGVKLIAPEVTNGRDPSTMMRPFYDIGERRRLLLRVENLKDFSASILSGEDHPIYLEIHLMDPPEGFVATSLRLCPLVVNWMMLATWTNAHSFPTGNGRWAVPGGDFLENECYEAEEVPDKKNLVRFDITDWYMFYMNSRNQNFGHILYSLQSVRIGGDANPSYAPAFRWYKK